MSPQAPILASNEQAFRSTLTESELVERLRQLPEPVAVVTHAKPDGDAAGSVIAMSEALRRCGKTSLGVLAPPAPESLGCLAGWNDLHLLGENAIAEAAQVQAASAIVVDTAAWSQLGPTRALVEPLLPEVIVIDHHLSGDIPSDRYVDTAAAATTEVLTPIVAQLLHHCVGSARFGPVIAQALFTGLATDTGWFRFSNTTARTHRTAARLLEEGVDQAMLYAALEQGDRPEKLALLERAMASLRLIASGRAAVMALEIGDFEQTGAREDETERIVDIPQSVGAVNVVCLATERRTDDGQGVYTRLSFRSKPGPGEVNVASLANRFGGGGHARAAGGRVEAPLAEALPPVVAAIEALFGPA
ncbi:MAG: DHH family phosphoesterase [Planctomycetota bacterium]